MHASAWEGLVAVVRRLRATDGCPWDRAQTADSLRPYWLEEAYEVLAAIDTSPDALRDELGDALFLLISFGLAREDAGDGTVDDIPASATRKMMSRHPGLFDDGRRHDGSLAAWEKNKRKTGTSALDGVPDALPALLRAHRVGEKASARGFDWPNVSGVRMKVAEELAELDAALASGDRVAVEQELGDLLFALSSLGRHVGAPAEDALRGALVRFEQRFRYAEAALARDNVTDPDADEVDRAWREAKASC